MILFSLFIVGVLSVFGLGYLFCSILASPVKYNSWVRVKTGFYSDFVGQVKNPRGFFKYIVRLCGKEVNNTLIDRINTQSTVWWFNLEVVEKPTELVKEDFYKDITRRDDDVLSSNSYTSVMVSAPYSTISNATSAISTQISVIDEDEY